MRRKRDGANACCLWGLGLLATAAGLTLLRLVWIVLISAPWSNLNSWLVVAIPLAIIGSALAIAGWARTAHPWLTASLACSWIYAVSLPVLLALDFGRSRVVGLEGYGSILFVGQLAMVPMMGLVSILWFVGYLETDLPRGRRLGWQTMQAGCLGLGTGLATIALGFFSLALRPHLSGSDRDWLWGIGSVVLALAAAGLATRLIGRIRPAPTD